MAELTRQSRCTSFRRRQNEVSSAGSQDGVRALSQRLAQRLVQLVLTSMSKTRTRTRTAAAQALSLARYLDADTRHRTDHRCGALA